MAEVLSPQRDNQTTFYSPRRSESNSYLINESSSSSSSSSSSPNLASTSHETNSNSMPRLESSRTHPPQSTASSVRGHAAIFSPSPSSRTSSSDLTNLLSLATTPASSVGSSQDYNYHAELDSDEDSYDESYDDGRYDGCEGRDESQEQESTLDTISDSSLHTPTVVDDTAVRQEPSQHVDYLSHDWKEEDVWSSWRHIVSQRKIYGEQSRLENAAWRTWVKNKYQLRTVSPETLNWLKESDVTWLYGPLKPAQGKLLERYESAPDSQISKNNSFIGHRKPILKKRSMSEVMLQKSISTSSLVKQAAASVQAQGKPVWKLDGLTLDCMNTEHFSFTAPSSGDGTSSNASENTSGTQTPSECREKRHIRFDDTVEQCIAVEAKPEEYDAEEAEDDERPGSSLSSNSSDEGLVMMHQARRPTLASYQTSAKTSSRSNSHQGRRTIETLPSTTLKYRTDSPEISEQQQQQAASKWRSRPRLSPSASQETLRPSRPSRNFLLGTDDGDEDDDDDHDDCHNNSDKNEEDSTWSFGSSNPRSSLGASASSTSLSRREAMPLPHSRSSSSSSLDSHKHAVASTTPTPAADHQPEVQRQLQALQSEPGAYGLAGMRRTESGMFMPEDDEDDDAMATGLLGRISETVNTARDIAHVIWNVGWRT